MTAKKRWRFMFRPETDAADLLAMPAAVAEGKITGKFLGSKPPPNTLLIQGVNKKGVICGADVYVRSEGAAEEEMDVARRPRTGRGGTAPLGAVHYRKFVEKENDRAPLVKRKPQELALLIYTSGTTGKPRGAMLKEEGFYYHSAACREVTAMNEKDRILLLLPLYHVYGINCLAISGLFFGAALVLVPQYDPLKLIETMNRSKTTFFAAVPTILIHLLQIASQKELSLPGSIRFTLTGAAPTPREVLNEFERVFRTEVCEGYGMTECTGLISINPPGKKKLLSVGKPVGELVPEVADLQMKVVDENGEELPPGETGEILVRTDKWGMLGYYNNPDATAEVIKDGWIHTGDLGCKDEDGYYYITDRKKDMIITGGINVYPREIEEVICSHPRVIEAAVIGEPHQSHGEVPRAIVVLKEGLEAEQEQIKEDIMDYCRNNLAQFKLPYDIEFRDALPKVLSGKVLKKELRPGFTDDRELRKDML